MDLLLAWVWFPLVLIAACAGWGLLVERAARRRLPGVLVAPVGFAALVVVTQWATLTDATAELAFPLALAGAVGGWALGRRRVSVDRWPALAAAAVFAVLGAPLFLSGEPTFAGYSVLGDTAIHFLGIDHLMEHGQEVSGLAPSTYSATVEGYYDGAGYPSGAHTPLGALLPLAGLDVAWVFQPYLALLGALTALCVWSLCTTLAPRERTLAAVLGSLPALYVGYQLVASLKEIATVLVVALLVALVPTLARPRAVLPFAVAAGAGLGVLSLAAAPWLGLVLLAGAVVVWRARGWRALLGAAALFAPLTALMGLSALVTLGDFVEVTETVTTNAVEMGNLLGPLELRQALPAWPVGDYRLDPVSELADAAVWASGAVLLIGLVRLRAWPVWLFLGVCVVATAYVVRRGSPWADAKALMMVSPAVATAAAAGALSWRPRPVRIVLVAVLAGGVAWSAALAYHDASLAPRDRLAELERIGEDLEGPVLAPEFEEFAKHFLRDAQPIVPGEAFQPHPIGFAPVERPGFGSSLDASHFTPEYLSSFRALVLRRSPVAPPAPPGFAPGRETEHYVVFEREESAEPAACDPEPIVLDLTTGDVPRFWLPAPPGVIAIGSGTLRATFTLERSEDLRVWLGGSIGREVTVRIDGRRVGAVGGARNYAGSYEPVGRVSLAAGGHELTIERPGGDLSPGDGSGKALGPVVLSRANYRCAS